MSHPMDPPMDRPMDHHPLLVLYPYGGTIFVLPWFANKYGCHIIVANSEESLLRTAKTVFFHKNDVNDVFGIQINASPFEAELVAPTQYMCSIARDVQFKRNVSEFHMHVVNTIFMTNGLIGKLPYPFKYCSCLNDNKKRCSEECVLGIKLMISKEDLYHQYKDAYLTQYPNALPKVNGHYSLARIAKYDEKISAAVNDGRDVLIKSVNHNSLPMCGDILFFFKQIRDIDKKPFDEQLERIKADQKRIKEKSREAFAAKKNQIQKLNLEKILQIFGS